MDVITEAAGKHCGERLGHLISHSCFLSCKFALVEVETKSKQVYLSIIDMPICISLVKTLVLPGDTEL